jgi:plastocyanin
VRRLALGIAAALAALAVPAAGMAPDGGHVSIGFAAYAPAKLYTLSGTTVSWTNDSVRNHTVTADDSSYDSGVLGNGEGYSRTYATPGTYGYYCRLHAGIIGEIDVHDVLLDPPPGPAATGREFPLRGRAAPGIHAVTIQADTGSGFAEDTTATVADDGTFVAAVTPQDTTTYRAVTAGDTSPPVTVLVLNRTVIVHVTGSGHLWSAAASVAPSSPGATVVLQLRLRDRFGWWPVAQAQLDRASRALLRTRLTHRVAARVLLTLPDGATPLALSRSFHVGR